MSKTCQEDKILNPETGRCVSRTSKKGKEVLSNVGKVEDKVEDKVLYLVVIYRKNKELKVLSFFSDKSMAYQEAEKYAVSFFTEQFGSGVRVENEIKDDYNWLHLPDRLILYTVNDESNKHTVAVLKVSNNPLNLSITKTKIKSTPKKNEIWTTWPEWKDVNKPYRKKDVMKNEEYNVGKMVCAKLIEKATRKNPTKRTFQAESKLLEILLNTNTLSDKQSSIIYKLWDLFDELNESSHYISEIIIREAIDLYNIFQARS